MTELSTPAKVRAFVERAERIDAEIAGLNEDKSEVFKEAKGEGFDTKALKAVIRERRKDAQVRAEEGELFDLYWNAVHGAPHVHAREAAE